MLFIKKYGFATLEAPTCSVSLYSIGVMQHPLLARFLGEIEEIEETPKQKPQAKTPRQRCVGRR